MPLHIYLKLRKCIAARITECERNRERHPKSKHWPSELQDCDTLMRWLDAQGTQELTRPKMAELAGVSR